jgi:hypothetical protein
MDKLNYMKPATQKFRELTRVSRHLNKMPAFEDKLIKAGPQFKHTWAQMAHMHDLRVWTLAYAPGRKGNIKRLQEIHLLNQECWYNISNAMWKRILVGTVLWFFVTRFAKDRYMKKNNVDSHDAHWRDTAAHM